MASQADGSTDDPISLAVPHYDEDTAELFSGAGFPEYMDEEYDGDEYYENDEEEYPREDRPSSLERSAAQRVDPHEATQTDILRDYTHFTRSSSQPFAGRKVL